MMVKLSMRFKSYKLLDVLAGSNVSGTKEYIL